MVPEGRVIPEVREVSKMEVVLEVGEVFRTQTSQEIKKNNISTPQLTMPQAAGKKPD